MTQKKGTRALKGLRSVHNWRHWRWRSWPSFGILYYQDFKQLALFCSEVIYVALVTAVRALESLHDFVAAQRDIFDSFERAALSLPGVGQTYRHDSHRSRRRKIFADESGEQDVELDGRRKFQVETFNVAIDMLTQSL